MKMNEHANTPSALDSLPKGDGVLNKTAIGLHNAVEKLASAADDAARLAIPAIDRAAEYAHRTVDKTAAGITPAADWLNEQATALNARQKKLVGDTREYVAANPLKSLGLALAAGYLVSRILRK